MWHLWYALIFGWGGSATGVWANHVAFIRWARRAPEDVYRFIVKINRTGDAHGWHTDAYRTELGQCGKVYGRAGRWSCDRMAGHNPPCRLTDSVSPPQQSECKEHPA